MLDEHKIGVRVFERMSSGRSCSVVSFCIIYLRVIIKLTQILTRDASAIYFHDLRHKPTYGNFIKIFEILRLLLAGLCIVANMVDVDQVSRQIF